jgi:polyphosphate kinase 2 (PPK2 family)
MTRPPRRFEEHLRRPQPRRLLEVDLSVSIDRATYTPILSELQHDLQRIQQAFFADGRRAVLVFEGWDAAGKGGTIRRLCFALDPRGCHVWPIGAPEGKEARQHYLQRFWSRLPSKGAMAVFDRSWYGRVLVERVEGFAQPSEWQRAYREINDFERLLADDGVTVVKLFFHVSQEAQLRRFRKRLTDPVKRWKLSAEDFRNRDRHAAYVEAIDEMLARTSTVYAPWSVIPFDDKKWGRLAALQTIVDGLATDLNITLPPLDAGVEQAARAVMGDEVVDAALRKVSGPEAAD